MNYEEARALSDKLVAAGPEVVDAVRAYVLEPVVTDSESAELLDNVSLISLPYAYEDRAIRVIAEHRAKLVRA